jgi:2-keto-3-deoxy-L-rhamnonate aldolase RhmA
LRINRHSRSKWTQSIPRCNIPLRIVVSLTLQGGIQVAKKGVLERLHAAEPVLSLGLRNARTSEIVRLAHGAGFGVVWIDLEHSSIPVDDAAQIAATALDLGMEGWVRTPEREYGVIGRLLNAGVTGIIAPRIETPDEARQLVAAARFPPRGQRSQIALLPQAGYRRMPTAELIAVAERATSVHVLLESTNGIRSAEAIAAVDGVDMLHVGVNDLSVDLGHVGNPGHPEVIDACLQVIAAGKRQGKLCAVGGLADVKQIQQLIAAGAAPLLFAAIDTDLLSAGLATRAQQWQMHLRPDEKLEP